VGQTKFQHLLAKGQFQNKCIRVSSCWQPKVEQL
jgi:hypothetical protein